MYTNATLKEFGKHEFEKVSTNTIVKNAVISKGLLFHYFENKKSLVEYLEDYVLNYPPMNWQVVQMLGLIVFPVGVPPLYAY